MSKRNRFIKVTVESMALKELRESRGLSVRKLAELMEISKTRVHQLESGREDISKEYIDKFLKVTKLSREVWQLKIGRDDKAISLLREKCHLLIDSIDPGRLELVHGLLQNL